MKYIDLPTRLQDRSQRRGNAMILVAAILTLLVILATAYLSRTRATRSTAAAHQTAAQREGSGEHVANLLAEELAQALFSRPLEAPANGFSFNPGDTSLPYVGDSNNARIESGLQVATDGSGIIVPGSTTVDGRVRRYSADRWYPFNHAPMHVAPTTNWPDDGGVNFPPVGPANGLGNPGFGDSRWLRSTEPLRWASNWQTTGQVSQDLNAFSHWQHMTYLARPDNGWRLCTDISDVGPQTTLMDLNRPVEQWLPAAPQNGAPFNSVSGNTIFPGDAPANFDLAWDNWFSGNTVTINPQNGTLVYANPALTPPNHYDLSDLNGDGTNYNYRDRPEAAYAKFDAVGNDNWRWYVDRRLNDTDGDGFTDSFWWIPPLPIKDGVHHVVGVSVVDLSGKLNLNTATIFRRNEDGRYPGLQATAGHTPADVALVGQEIPPVIANVSSMPDGPVASSTGTFNWNTGFFDNPMNQPGHLQAITAARSWVYHPNTPSSNSNTNQNNMVLWPHLNWYANSNGSPTDDMPRWRLFNNYTSDPFIELFGLNGNREFWDEAYDDPQNSEIHPWATQQGRLRYWNLKGSRPDDPLAGLTSLDLSEELELVAYHGQNRPHHLSSLENYAAYGVTGSGTKQLQTGPFRANTNREETSESKDQLTNQQLVFDNRRKLTGYNGARNDELPNWLRFSRRRPKIDTPDQWDYPKAFQGASEFERVKREFDDQRSLKLDLREDHYDWELSDPRLAADPNTGDLTLAQRLAPTLMMALTDGPEMTDGESAFTDDLDPAGPFHSYFGAYNSATDSEYLDTQRLAAAYAANILQWRDSDIDLNIVEAVPLPDVGIHQPQVNGQYFLGVEPQPFILEVFVAHVHSAQELPERDQLGIEYRDEDQGAHTVFENKYGPCADGTGTSETPQPTPTGEATDPNWQSTIVVVQIANPFNVAIDLSDYVIDVFGQQFQISALVGTPTADPSQQPAFTAEQLWLPPGTPEAPYTAVFYAMDESLSRLVQQGSTGANETSTQEDLEAPWIDFLDLKVKPIWTNAPQSQSVDLPAVDLPSYDYDNPDNTPTLQEFDPDGKRQGTLVINVNRVHEELGLPPAWRTYRCWYDSELDSATTPGSFQSVQLKRYVDPMPQQPDPNGPIGGQQPPQPVLVVVDRLDDPVWAPGGNTNALNFDDFNESFAGAVDAMGEDINRVLTDAPDLPLYEWLNPNQSPAAYQPSGLTLDQNNDTQRFTHWTQWVRASRSWGYDRDGNGTYDADERNPRFVFADRVITKPAKVTGFVADDPGSNANSPDTPNGGAIDYTDISFFDGQSGIPNQSQSGTDATGIDPLNSLAGGQRFNMSEPPDDETFAGTVHTTDPREAWFLRDYRMAGALTLDDIDNDDLPNLGNPGALVARKPTFFNFAIERTALADFNPQGAIKWYIPDKGWYGQAQAGTGSGGTTGGIGGGGNQDGDLPEFSQEAAVYDPSINGPNYAGGNPDINVPENVDQSRSRYWYPMQMLHKNGDFEQIGELNNVWLFGHEIFMRDNQYANTLTTFSEFMSRQEESLTGTDTQVNRLRVKPSLPGTAADHISPASAYWASALQTPSGGTGAALSPTDPRWQQPVVPIGSRVFDAFVCDGLGEVWDVNGDYKTDARDRRLLEDWRFSNANGFSGQATPGLVNVNTATVEVLRAMPHMYKAVHMDFHGMLDDDDGDSATDGNPLDLNPRVALPEAIIHYRDLLGGANVVNGFVGTDETGYRYGPYYHTRGTNWRSATGGGGTQPLVSNMRDEPGVASIGELLLLDRGGIAPSGGVSEMSGFPAMDSVWTPVDRHVSNDSYRIGFAGLDPFRVNDRLLGTDDSGDGQIDSTPLDGIGSVPNPGRGSLGAYLGTDTQTTHNPNANGSDTSEAQYLGDSVASDSEEANLLFSGISNLITTRSDLFLVYFNVRGFKETRYPDGSIAWDATNKDAIVDESRWVMIVDRSQVNVPSDEPRILLLERVDN